MTPWAARHLPSAPLDLPLVASVAGARGLAGLERSTVRAQTAGADTTVEFPALRVRQYGVSVDVALQAGVPGVIQGDLSVQRFVLVYELMLVADERIEVDSRSGEVYLRESAAGLSLVIKVSRVRADFSVDFAAVAAATRAGFATTQLEVATRGLPADAASLGSNLPSDLLSKPDGAERVAAVVEAAQARMADPDASLEPTVRRFSLGFRADDAFERAQAEVFAYRSIRSGRTLRDALILNTKRALDPRQIRATYEGVTGNFDESTPPSKTAMQQAGDWLDL